LINNEITYDTVMKKNLRPRCTLLKGQRGQCSRLGSILRRPCAYYYTRTLFTHCRLQCVTVMNILSAVSRDRAVHNCNNIRQRVKTEE